MTVNCYITFYTTYSAIRAEKVLKSSTLEYRMVPVPRSISSSCGTALLSSCDQAAAIEQYLKQHQVEFEALHRVEEKELRLPFFPHFKRGEQPDAGKKTR